MTIRTAIKPLGAGGTVKNWNIDTTYPQYFGSINGSTYLNSSSAYNRLPGDIRLDVVPYINKETNEKRIVFIKPGDSVPYAWFTTHTFDPKVYMGQTAYKLMIWYYGASKLSSIGFYPYWSDITQLEGVTSYGSDTWANYFQSSSYKVYIYPLSVAPLVKACRVENNTFIYQNDISYKSVDDKFFE